MSRPERMDRAGRVWKVCGKSEPDPLSRLWPLSTCMSDRLRASDGDVELSVKSGYEDSSRLSAQIAMVWE